LAAKPQVPWASEIPNSVPFISPRRISPFRFSPKRDAIPKAPKLTKYFKIRFKKLRLPCLSFVIRIALSSILFMVFLLFGVGYTSYQVLWFPLKLHSVNGALQRARFFAIR
jgi:hypothetical protein